MTDIRDDGLIRESLYSGTALMRVSGLVREVLRSTGTGIGTYFAVDGMVREVLREMPPVVSPARGGPMVTMIW